MNRVDDVHTGMLALRSPRYRTIALLGVLILLALAVRFWLMWHIVSDDGYFGGSDDVDYHALGMALANHGQLAQHGQPTAYRMPLFPLFLALIYRVAGPDRIVAQVVIMLLSALNVGLTYLVGRQLGTPRAALIAALLGVFDLDQISYAGQLMTETLCTCLFTLSMLALVALRRRGGWRWAVGTGLILGLTVLLRVNILLLVPVAAGWLLRYGSGTWRSRLLSVILIGALCGGMWGSWVLRNYVVFGSFIPLTTQGGNGYYGVYNDQAAAPQPINRFGIWHNMPLSAAIRQANEIERDRMQRQLAIEWIQAHPGRAAQIALVQVYHFWNVEINPLYVPLLTLALAGLVLLMRQGDPDGLLWLLMFVSMSALSMITLAVPRFHIPLLPGIAALAGVAVDRGWPWLARLISSRYVRRPA